MKKMENFLRRVLSMVLCLCMLTGNMGGALAADGEAVPVPLAESVSTNHAATLRVTNVGTTNAPNNQPSNKYTTWYWVDVILTEQVPSIDLDMHLNPAATGNVSVSGYYSADPNSSEMGDHLTGWYNNPTFSANKQNNGTLVHLSAQAPIGLGGQGNLDVGRYRFLLSVELSNEQMAAFINGTDTLDATFNGLTLGGVSETEIDPVVTSVNMKPTITKTSSVFDYNGDTYIKWDLHVEAPIKLNNTVVTDTITGGSFLEYVVDYFGSGVNSLDAHDHGYWLNAQQAMSNDNTHMVATLSNTKDGSNYDYFTDLNLLYYTKVPAGVDPTNIKDSYSVKFNGLGNAVEGVVGTDITKHVVVNLNRFTDGEEQVVGSGNDPLYVVVVDKDTKRPLSSVVRLVTMDNQLDGNVTYAYSSNAVPCLITTENYVAGTTPLYGMGDVIVYNQNKQGNAGEFDVEDFFGVEVANGEESIVFNLTNDLVTIPVTVTMKTTDPTTGALVAATPVTNPPEVFLSVLGDDYTVYSKIVKDLTRGSEAGTYTTKIMTTSAAMENGGVRVLQLKPNQQYDQNKPVYNAAKFDVVGSLASEAKTVRIDTDPSNAISANDFYSVTVTENEDGSVKIDLLNNRLSALNGLADAYKRGELTVNEDGSFEGFQGGKYYTNSSPLGIAGNFHIVAFEEAHLVAHTNGNVLAKDLYAGGNGFGTNPKEINGETIVLDELSYVVNYKQVTGNSAAHDDQVLALGANNKLELVDNGTYIAVNGTKLNYPKNVVIDVDTEHPFINLATVESQVRSLSDSLKGYSNVGVGFEHLDSDKQKITLNTNSGAGYYNMTGAQLTALSGSGGTGSADKTGAGSTFQMHFTEQNSGTIVMNINCEGCNTVVMPHALVYIDGEQQATSEVVKFENGKVIWNFYNAEGTHIHANNMTGMIVAPGATVTTHSNVNGTIIADYVWIEAESHRTDFVGTTSPARANFSATKLVDGKTPSSSETFHFKLELDNGNGTYTVVSTATNSGRNVVFDYAPEFTEKGEYWYRVSEDTDKMPEGYHQKVENEQYFIKLIITETKVLDTVFYNTAYEYYDLDKTTKLDGNQNLVFHNSAEQASFTLIKQDAATNNLLPGAEFTLWKAKQQGSGRNVTWVTDGEPIAVGTTDSVGRLSFFNLSEGKYLLKETTPPHGYLQTNNAGWLVEIDRNGVVNKIKHPWNMGGSIWWQDGDGGNATLNKADKTITITNTASDQSITISGAKVWDDANNQDGYRPTSVTLKLYQQFISSTLNDDGEVVEEVLQEVELTDKETTLNADSLDKNGNWAFTFADLPKFGKLDGKTYALKYDVREETVSEYITSYTTNEDGTLTITNKHVPEKTSVTVVKKWDDRDNALNTRPKSITYTLFKIVTNDDDTETKSFYDTRTVEPTSEGVWPAVTFGNLNKFENGKPLRYELVEEEVAGYESAITGGPNTYTVTNTLKKDLIDISVKKVWDHKNNTSAKPAHVYVTLYRVWVDGETEKREVVGTENFELSESNGWTNSWNDLIKSENGINYGYELVESPVTNYDADYQWTDNEDGTYTCTVTNTYAPKVNVYGSKTWVDKNDITGQRPDDITVILLADGQEINRVVVSQTNGWRWEFENLPKYNEKDEEIVYSIGEVEIPNYSTTIDGYDITNTLVVNIPVEKYWQDNNNENGLRDDVQVELYKSVNNSEPVSTGKTITLTESTGWTGSFEKVPMFERDAQGVDQLITYSVKEVNVVDGYVATEGREANTTTGIDKLTVTNTLDTFNITGTKVWEDNNNQDNKRPETITITLKSGEDVIGTIVMAEQADEDKGIQSWNSGWSFNNLPKKQRNDSGKVEEIVYTIEETIQYKDGVTADDEYKTTYKLGNADVSEKVVTITSSTNASVSVINTRETDKTSVTVTKRWLDGGNTTNRGDIRVQLKANGVAEGEIITLNSDNEWIGGWQNLPVNDANGPILYTVEELTTDPGTNLPYAWTAFYEPGKVVEMASNAFTITNTELTDVTVTKKWVNAVGKTLPTSVEVELTANGEPTGETVTIKPATDDPHGAWTVETFAGLPKYDENNELIEYGVQETSTLPAGFTWAPNKVSDYEFEVVNTFTASKTSLDVTKVWVDGEDELRYRPESITVKLMITKGETTEQYEDKYVVLNKDNNWTGSFSDLPIEIDGESVSYSVEEVLDANSVAKGYVQTSNTVNGTTATITNTLALVNVTVEKHWDDQDNRDSMRPTSLEVVLTADEEGAVPVGDAKVELSSSNNWTCTWNNLPKYKAQRDEAGNLVLINYTVTESALTNDYELTETTKTETTTGYKFDLTNSRDVDTFTLNGTKLWSDNSNQDGKRPASITVALEVKEVTPAATEGGAETTAWEQATDANGVAIVPVTVTANSDKDNTADIWYWCFENLPVNKAGGLGEKLTYRVVETIIYADANAKKYTTTYSAEEIIADGSNKAVTITNSYETDKVSITVNKVWNDSTNAANVRPATVEVQLMKKVGDTFVAVEGQQKTLTGNDWTVTFDGLDKYENGNAIVYKVEETFVVGDTRYTYVKNDEESISTDSDDRTIQLTNTLELVDVSVEKEWVDQENKYGSRPDSPDSIEITLWQNGKDYDSKTMSADANGDWKVTFNNLPKFDKNGAAYTYTVTETVDYTGLDYNYTEGAPETVTVAGYEFAYKLTNTLETTTLSGTKTWNDELNAFGTRTELELTVYADGEELKDAAGESVTFTVPVPADVAADAAWQWTSELKLPKYKAELVDGQKVEIVYTVKEADIPGYTNNTATTTTNALVNTLVKTNVEVTKQWNDNNDQDGVRPETITLTLYGDNKVVTGIGNNGSVTLNVNEHKVDDNTWKYTFENLPKYRSELVEGELVEIAYTVVETVNTYTPSYQPATKDVETGNTLLTVINTYAPGKVPVTVTKVWEDNGNSLNVRPATIVVKLWKQTTDGDVAVIDPATGTQYEITLPKADGSLTHTFEDLDEYENGQLINYTATEEVTYTDGYYYSEKITGDAANNIVLTNTLETVDVQVTKQWTGEEGNTTYRPEKIVVKLWQNAIGTGEAYDSRDIIPGTDASNVVTFSNLPKYMADGETAVTYYVTEEVEYADGAIKYYYESTISNDGKVVNDEATITNKMETIDLNGKKVWDDQNNAYNTRPDSVTISIYNGDELITTVEAEADDDWTWTAENLPKYQLNAAGQKVEIAYEVKEVKVIGYEDGEVTTETITDAETNETTTEYVVTNTLETIDVYGLKTWTDNSNQDGKRPVSITIDLKDGNGSVIRKVQNGDGTVTEEAVSVTLETAKNSGDKWNWSFTDLPKYDKDTGDAIEYYVTESITYATGTTEEFFYTPAVGNPVTDEQTGDISIEIENSYNSKKVGLSLTKFWADDNNRDAVRPESITIRVVGTVGTKEVFTKDYPVNGDMFDDSWSWSIDANGADALDKFADGEVIDYKLYEVGPIAGYTEETLIEATETETNAFELTNTHAVTTITVSGKKVWNDDSNRDGIRPASVTLTITSSDPHAAPIASVVVEAKDDETNEWSYTSAELPKYMVTTGEDGKPKAVEIVYTVTEDEKQLEGTGYELESIVGTTVTNKHVPDTTSIKVTKVWKDDDNRDGKQAPSIKVILTATVNGTVVDDLCKTTVLDESNNWTDTFEDLYVNYEGNAVTYDVDEENVPAGYTKTISGPVVDGKLISYTITNEHVAELVTISVEKIWEDAKNQDNKRPADVQVQLYKVVGSEEIAIGAPVTLDDTNQWKHTYDSAALKLYRYENGTEIDYTVKEVQVPAGYTADVVETTTEADTGKTYAYTVTNTHAPEKTKVEITKVWDDNNNQDGKRKPITFVLYADDTATEHKVTLTEAELTNNEWSYTFIDLDRYANGSEIVYTVKEESVPAGYTADYADTLVEKDAGAETVTTYAKVTNKHEIEKTQVVVNKVWDDDSNRDGIRTSITLQLMADEVEMGDAITLKLDEQTGDSWTYTFKDLDLYKDGKKIAYTVQELTAIDGYTTSTDRQVTDAETTVTITNKHEPSEITVNGLKTWNDAENQDGKRPAEIKIVLLADNVEKESVTVTEADGWAWSFDKLPEYRAGKVGEKVVYTVTEILEGDAADAYTVSVNGYDVTNTHELETVDITGSKTWVDLDNKYLKRPDSVTIRLLADGVEIDSRMVTEAENWSWTFTGLPKYKAGEVGKAITYTIKEDVVTGYITTINDFNVTNTMNLVEFIKLDQQTGKRLPGASFALYEGTAATYDASKPVETWVSTKDAKILAGLKVGQTYTIVETKAPSGYAMMAPFQFTVELTDIPGTYRSFSLSNCHVYRFRKLDSATGALVEGAHMAVLDANNSTVASWYSNGGNDGWYEIADSKLKAGIEYKLVELESPWGYELADPIPFTIDANDGKLIINGSKSNSLDMVMFDEPWPEVTPTPEPTETSFTVTKRWEDKDNVLGLRPSSITVHLYRKLRTDAEYPTVPFMSVNMMSNGKDVWKFTFNDLPRRSPDGILYDYSIREEEVEGYVVSYLNNGRTIVNTIPEEDYPPTPTPTLPYVTPTPTRMPRIPAGVQFVDGEWMYIDEYGIPLGGIPLTGDNTNFVLWGMAIGLPLLVAALAAVEIRRRKKLLVAAEQDEEVDEEA